MGLWTDAQESIYVAVPAEKLVLKVTADGKTNIAVRTTGLWSVLVMKNVIADVNASSVVS
jgi:hypothetical protein